MTLRNLPKPFFVLAPMDDVTDTVFRQIISDCAPADVYFTEFVNVDGLQSAGREKLMPKLRFTDKERPLIAQVWGKNPENFYKTALLITELGFDGMDLNFGCPEKNVVRSGVCSAFILPENRDLAIEIIKACQRGLVDGAKIKNDQKSGGDNKNIFTPLPLSVKTRVGFNSVDLTWHELLLNQKLNMLTIHGRTRKQMSKVPADWEIIGQVRQLRDKISPATLIVGNGDVLSRSQGEALAKQHNLDGVMVGRGIFHDPFVFAHNESGVSPWDSMSKEAKIALYRKHVELFAKTWKNNERKLITLNKFCKIYINGFDGAKELREKLMVCTSADDLLALL